MKVYLGDLAHDYVAGANMLTGEIDYTVPLNIGYIAAHCKQTFGDKVDVSLFKFPKDLLNAIDV